MPRFVDWFIDGRSDFLMDNATFRVRLRDSQGTCSTRCLVAFFTYLLTTRCDMRGRPTQTRPGSYESWYGLDANKVLAALLDEDA